MVFGGGLGFCMAKSIFAGTVEKPVKPAITGKKFST